MKRILPSESDFPANGSDLEKLRFLVEYAVLAPSSHNSQPWLFITHDHNLALHADRTRGLPVVDPHDRELVISCGCALFNLRVAAAHFGVPLHIVRNPDDHEDRLANLSIDLQAGRHDTLAELFVEMPRRVTNRFPYQPGSVSADDLHALAELCAAHGVTLRSYTDDASRHAIAERIAEADKQQMASHAFRRELAGWLHHNRSGSLDGMPGYVFGFSELASLAAPLVVRTFDLGEGQAARDRELAEHSPALCILSTNADHHLDWIRTGEALQHLLLEATRRGLAAGFMNQPIEIDRLRQDLAQHVGARFPQVLLRLGKPTREAKATARRPADAVTIDAGLHENYRAFQGF
ncbi:MAG: nitroreductase [Planctomycetes bacterium]|nr:nitroreductase [Planctomycetota bacterium]MCB9935158.1 nitroreductase [Planctomycetota bacterium]